jgi:hypothetical protein
MPFQFTEIFALCEELVEIPGFSHDFHPGTAMEV